MAAYVCEVCGMSIGSMTCGTCDSELDNDTITTDPGVEMPARAWHGQITHLLWSGHGV